MNTIQAQTERNLLIAAVKEEVIAAGRALSWREIEDTLRNYYSSQFGERDAECPLSTYADWAQNCEEGNVLNGYWEHVAAQLEAGDCMDQAGDPVPAICFGDLMREVQAASGRHLPGVLPVLPKEDSVVRVSALDQSSWQVSAIPVNQKLLEQLAEMERLMAVHGISDLKMKMPVPSGQSLFLDPCDPDQPDLPTEGVLRQPDIQIRMRENGEFHYEFSEAHQLSMRGQQLLRINDISLDELASMYAIGVSEGSPYVALSDNDAVFLKQDDVEGIKKAVKTLFDAGHALQGHTYSRSQLLEGAQKAVDLASGQRVMEFSDPSCHG